jgi:putative protease
VFDFAWKKELESVSHRPYHTGYYFDKATENANTTSFGGYLRENAYLAIVRAYDEKTGVALLQQRNKYTKGDAVELLTPGKTGIPFIAGEMWNEANEPIEAVPHPQMKYYMKMPFAVKAGDILRAAPEKER